MLFVDWKAVVFVEKHVADILFPTVLFEMSENIVCFPMIAFDSTGVFSLPKTIEIFTF